ncbi:hypothetical protein P5E67_00670 [Vibrio parahaemolyticus]|nr:hypothetical protein [Vibrio parahaemolyticus]
MNSLSTRLESAQAVTISLNAVFEQGGSRVMWRHKHGVESALYEVTGIHRDVVVDDNTISIAAIIETDQPYLLMHEINSHLYGYLLTRAKSIAFYVSMNEPIC